MTTQRRFRRFYRRRFLNRPRHHQGAHLIADVDLSSYKNGKWYVDADLHLSDCYRAIDLDFDAENRAEATNALRKIAILREVLAEFETALEAAVAEMVERNAR